MMVMQGNINDDDAVDDDEEGFCTSFNINDDNIYKGTQNETLRNQNKYIFLVICQ